MSTDELPPHSIESEQVVIGGLLTDAQTALRECSTLIGDNLDVFYDIRHKTLYEVISRMTMAGKPVCVVSVLEQLRLDGQLNNIGGLSYLAQLPEKCPSAAGVGYFAEILLEYHQKRRLIAIGTSAATEASGSHDVAGLIAKIVEGVTGLAKVNVRKEEKTFLDLVRAAVDELERCYQAQGLPMGIRTGYPDFDKKTGGLHNGDMVVIAARPSMGKTSLAMNIVEHVAVNDRLPVGVFSLEMTAESLTTRMLCSRAKVSIRGIQDGFLSESDRRKIVAASSSMARAPVHIDDSSGLTVFEMRHRAIRMKERYGIKLIVIDYLQLMRGTQRKNDNRQSEVAEISNGVKSIAKELGVPVVVLSQLNRDMEREKNRRPRLSDLRESGAIEQDADLVCFLWKQGAKGTDADDDNSAEVSPVTLTIAKQRNGPTGDINLTFLKQFTRFESAAKIEYNRE